MNRGSVRNIIQDHWDFANRRDWSAFARLLHPSLYYDCPQTREYIDGAAGYLEMFTTWPGDWRADIVKLVCDEREGLSVIRFVVGAEVMSGLSLFELDDGGLITRVTDHWPEPYEPPPRATPHLQRRPAA